MVEDALLDKHTEEFELSALITGTCLEWLINGVISSKSDNVEYLVVVLVTNMSFKYKFEEKVVLWFSSSPEWCTSFESVAIWLIEIAVGGTIEQGPEVDDSILEYFETLNKFMASLTSFFFNARHVCF